jgi:hypothetical protein
VDFTLASYIRHCTTFSFNDLSCVVSIFRFFIGVESKLLSSLQGVSQKQNKESLMRWSTKLFVLFPFLCASLMTPALAQEQSEEIESLPTELSLEQLQTLQQLSVAPIPQELQTRVRGRLPMPVFPLTPEELSYREAVRKLGVDKHLFVHCELRSGKVRTGVIEQFNDEGLELKSGIVSWQFISYADLKAAPRPVSALGTRIGLGFKWVGLAVVTIPLLPFAFLFWDGC